MHVLSSIFWVYVKCVSNKLKMNKWLGIIILRFSKKKGSVEILVRSSISTESQTKIDFKVTASW